MTLHVVDADKQLEPSEKKVILIIYVYAAVLEEAEKRNRGAWWTESRLLSL